MAQIQSFGGQGSISYANPASWVGGVIPLQANGDTSYINYGDIFDEIPSGELCDENHGEITVNNGTVTTNFWTIVTNNWIINTLDGTSNPVTDNYYQIDSVTYGTGITTNRSGATITYLDGYVTDNYGNIGSTGYNGRISNNQAGATIYSLNSGSACTNNLSGAVINYVYGYLDFNDGQVDILGAGGGMTSNNLSGFISSVDNGGNCDSNYGTISTLNGYVNSNYYQIWQTNGGGVVNTNYSTGTLLHAPSAQCNDNYGQVYNIAGTVNTNQSGGIIATNGGYGSYIGYLDTNYFGGYVAVNDCTSIGGGGQSTINYNYGKVEQNFGIINNCGSTAYVPLNGYNGNAPSGYITQNDGIVDINEYGATIVTNSPLGGAGIVGINRVSATINNNYGYVTLNDAQIDTNYFGGIITENTGNISSNSGTVNLNSGRVAQNDSAGVILKHVSVYCDSNYGTVYVFTGAFITVGNSGSYVYFGDLGALITDSGSGLTYGIGSGAFTDPVDTNVEVGTDYNFETVLHSGQLIGGGAGGGLTLTTT